VDLAPHGILVNSLSPGFTLTELTESMLTPEEIAALAAQVPLGRIADPMEMAQAVLFLCSDLNTFITGQNIVVDGGFTIV
jgi:3-oxoacyl-[acyl-carrier protein] reductase